MTTQEKITVMQAFVDGKQIEFEHSTGEWKYVTDPNWDWDHFDYRIKPEPQYAPYETIFEVPVGKIAIKNDGSERRMITGASTERDPFFVLMGALCVISEHFLKEWKFEDGSPCGKKVGE